MNTLVRTSLKYLPLVLGLAILAVAVPFVPWAKVGPYLARLSPVTLGLLTGLGALYYFGRILRYWLMLRMLERPARFDQVAVACLVAQPVAVLPGGELYRASMLKRYANVSMKHGSPSVFAQSIIEAMGLIGLALLGAAALHRYVAIVLGLAIIMVLIWAAIKWQSAKTSHKLINNVPKVTVSLGRVAVFMEKNRTLFHRKNFAILLGATLISTVAGAGMIMVASQALGSNLSFLQAIIGYTLPTALEAVSFLPAGLGINEQGSVGIFRLFGMNLALAVALTILVRLFTLGIGFVFGFAAMGWARLAHYRRYD